MGITKFSVEMTTQGTRVWLGDAEDELDPCRYRFLGVRPGELPNSVPALVMECSGEGTIEGEGVVIVQPQQATGDAVMGWLDSLDPVLVSKAIDGVLDDPGFDDDRPSAHTIEAMRRLARA